MQAFPFNDLPRVRELVAALQQQALQQGLGLRCAPPEPTSCCGRGCNGCVWEGFYAATAGWCEEAQRALSQPAARRA